MKHKRILKYIAIFVLVTYISTFGVPTQQLALAKSLDNIRQAKADIKYDKPTVSTKLGGFTDMLLADVEKMKSSLEKSNLKNLKDQLAAAKSALKDTRQSIREELDKNSKNLEGLNAVNAKERNESFKAEMEAKLSNFEALFDETDRLASTAVVDNGALKNSVEKIQQALNPEQPQQALGTLPHNNADVKPPEPAIGGGISPSYASADQTTASEQELPRTPTDGDLAEIAETRLTGDIKSLADSLGTPVKIYEYVKNNIDFEPYYGSRKGAAGTLDQMAGNDYDQASLLIAMLRYRKIPSRYVVGTVEVPVEKVMSWTGAKTPEAAVKILGSLGRPTVSMVSGGNITAVRFEHIWVEAYVPYENYRGAGEMKGKEVWVPLDPSIKQYSEEKGIDIKGIAGVTDEQVNAAFKINADIGSDGDTITNMNTSQMSSFLDGITSKVQQYIKDNNLEGTDTKTLMGLKKIIPENLSLLPITLPYKTVTVLSEANTVPIGSSEKIGFSIRGNDPFNLNFAGSNDFNVELKAVELYGKRITLSWIPATQEDSDIIKSYGGLFKTPAYMIQLKPQVKADGEVIAEGVAAGFGNRQEFTIAMGHVGMSVEDINNPVTVGGFYSIDFDYGKIDTKELDAIRSRLSAVKDTATEESIYTDEVMGEILNSVGKAYFGQLDGINSIIASSMKVSSVRQVSEAMTGYSPNVKYMFSTPVEVAGGSFFIDVDHDVLGVNSLEGNKKAEIGYMMNTGVMGSSMEHVIYEQIFQVPSVSSIKILTEASSRGIPIYTICRDNIGKISELNVSSAVKTDITNAVNSGKIVMIPQKAFQYYQWQGSGYIVMDPETGAAGYMISGGLAGGSTGVNIAVTLMGLAALIWAIYDTVTIAMAFLAATNPIVGIVFFALYIVSVINIMTTMQDIMMYWETGDYKYAASLMKNLLMNIAFMGVGKVLEWIAPGIMALFKGAEKQMDTVAELAAKYGDDAAEIAARYGDDAVNVISKYGDDAVNAIKNYGDDALQLINKYGDDALRAITEHGGDAVRAIRNYGDDALRAINQYGTDAVVAITKYGEDALSAITRYGDEAVSAISKYGGNAVQAITKYGDNAMNAITKYGGEAVEMITKYGDDAVRNITKYGEDGLTALYAYGDDLVQNIAKYGDDAVGSAIKYGDNAITAMKNGIEPGIIGKLDGLGISPADFSKYGITTKDAADTAVTIFEEVSRGIPLMKTTPDTAFFWSGRTNGIGGELVAKDIASRNGGVTLEMMIEANHVNMPAWSSDPLVQKAWGDISQAYASQVTGEVRAVIGDTVRTDSIWLTRELPNLMSNPNVTKIITIDPFTLVETVIFTR